ncbi:hypothetical protein [Effusibacillus lacus]|uniref:MFS transporter n=1 Tax=Effusibacillus lacus TaxID=1348429 RepID=A0A292YII1_9BACL|nr:hypothetical protein [Effusibacillus lacus]TCS74436.1 hypothetical protein EDD64_11338 [Effusibacillus lacus]GAX88691.1 MFS transporter [Effusibacillus lacus]
MDAAYKHLRHNIKYGNIQGIFEFLSLNLYNPFIPIFAIKVLHASDQQVAWLSSLPAVTGILALIPGAIFMDKLVKKKTITAVTLLSARMFILLIALIPFFPASVGISGIFAPMVGVAIYKATSMNIAFFVAGTIRVLGALAFGLVLWWENHLMRRESDGLSA